VKDLFSLFHEPNFTTPTLFFKQSIQCKGLLLAEKTLVSFMLRPLLDKNPTVCAFQTNTRPGLEGTTQKESCLL
jgi:hypothetical protein